MVPGYCNNGLRTRAISHKLMTHECNKFNIHHITQVSYQRLVICSPKEISFFRIASKRKGKHLSQKLFSL